MMPPQCAPKPPRVLTFMLAQAVAGPMLPPRPRSDAPCPVAADPQEVVVCARDQESFRLRPLPGPDSDLGLPRARTSLAGGTLAAEAEQGMLANGQSVPRLMLRWRVPIGRKRR